MVPNADSRLTEEWGEVGIKRRVDFGRGERRREMRTASKRMAGAFQLIDEQIDDRCGQKITAQQLILDYFA